MNCRLKAAKLPRCKDVGSNTASQPGDPRGPAIIELGWVNIDSELAEANLRSVEMQTSFDLKSNRASV